MPRRRPDCTSSIDFVLLGRSDQRRDGIGLLQHARIAEPYIRIRRWEWSPAALAIADGFDERTRLRLSSALQKTTW